MTLNIAAPEIQKYFLDGDGYVLVTQNNGYKITVLNNDLIRIISGTLVAFVSMTNEDAEHYFFQCKLYYTQRITLFHETRIYISSS